MELNIIKALNLKHSIQNTISKIKELGDSNICIVVPDKLSATMEKIVFEKLNIDSSFNINISTLNRLSKNILAETNAKYKTISKIGGIILLKKVLNENKQLITSFRNEHNSYKYSNEIYKTLAQLKACQLGSDELVNYRCEQEILQRKINDLGYILENYNNAKVGVLDNSDTLTLTCMMLDKSETVKNTYYIFTGFDDFTSQGFNLIERLMNCSLGVWVNVYCSNGFNKNVYYQDVMYRLISMCNTIGAKINILEETYVDDDLHKYLTNNLFAFNKLNFNLKTNDTIRLYQAQNITDELDFVARDIRKKILNGARFRDFGIAVYNLDTNVDLIKQVFNKYDLCTYIDTQKSFSSTIIYKFFVNLLQIFAKNYDTLNLIEFINSPFINIDDKHRAFIIEKIKKFNYRGNLSTLLVADEEVAKDIKVLSEFLSKYFLNANSNIADIETWHNNIITELNIEEKIFNIVNNLEDSYEQKILSQAIKHSNQLLQEIKEFYPNSTLEEVLDIYEQAGMELSISPLPLSADCIQVIDANEVLTDFNNLYLVNCKASTAPSILQDVGILLDKELTYVQLSHNIEPTIARMNRITKFKLFNSVLMFNNSVCITMSLASNSEISPLVLELKNRIVVLNNKNEENELSYITPHLIEEKSVYTPLSLWDLVEYVYTHNVDIDEYVQKVLMLNKITRLSTEIKVDKTFTQLNEISASALETYFQCPFKYFFNYVLKLKEEVSGEIEMLDIGNILHELAHRYYLIKDRNNIDIHNFCTSVVNNLVQKDEKLAQHINNPILVNLIAEGERFIAYLKRFDENTLFKPAYFEKSFGGQADFASLPLTDTVSLKGKVDRIDFYNNYFRIIDYKSGSADATLSELYYGKKLQLFLYGLAISNATHKQLSGTFYLPIKNVVEKAENNDNIYKLLGFYTNNLDNANAYDINLQSTRKSEFVNISLKADGNLSARTDKVLTESEMETMLNYAKQISIKAINQITSGIYNASPLKFDERKNACNYCPYLVLCLKSANNIEFREVEKVTKDSFLGGNNE